MQPEQVPIDPRNPRPMSFSSKEEEIRAAQTMFTDMDILRKRPTLDPACIARIEVDGNESPETAPWVRLKGDDPREHDYYAALMKIVTTPGVKGSLLPADTRAIRGTNRRATHGRSDSAEIPVAVELRTHGKNTGCARPVMLLTTSHGRKFTYDPECPKVDGNPRTMGQSPFLCSEGATRLMHGFTGRHVWDFGRGAWIAERESRGAFELTPSQLSFDAPTEAPEPYCLDHFEPIDQVYSVGAR